MLALIAFLICQTTKLEVKNRTHDLIRTFGGGLLVYIKDNLEYERLFDLEINELEIIWLKIKPFEVQKLYFGCGISPTSYFKIFRYVCPFTGKGI